MTSMVNVVVGGCFILAVILTYRLHVLARKKIIAMIDKDDYFGGGVFKMKRPNVERVESDFET